MSSPDYEYEVFAPVPAEAFTDAVPSGSQDGRVRLDFERGVGGAGVVSARLNFAGAQFKLSGLRTLGKTSAPEDARASLDLLRTLTKPELARTWASKVQLYQVVHTKGSRQVAEPLNAALIDGRLQFQLQARNPPELSGKQLAYVYLFRELDKTQTYVHFTAGSRASVLMFSEQGGAELFKDVQDASELRKASHPNLHVVGAAAFYAQAMRLTK